MRKTMCMSQLNSNQICKRERIRDELIIGIMSSFSTSVLYLFFWNQQVGNNRIRNDTHRECVISHVLVDLWAPIPSILSLSLYMSIMYLGNKYKP